MRRYGFLVTVALAAVAGCRPGTQPPPQRAVAPRAARVMTQWRADLDSLAIAVDGLDSAVRSLGTQTDVPRAIHRFRVARARFKRVELALEYYAPSTTRALNGPPVPEVEDAEGPEMVIPPSGFQVVEALLFGPSAETSRDALTAELSQLRAYVARARTMFAAQQTTDAHVWDAMRLELARIMTLGLAGFDASVSGDALTEADAALAGVEATLGVYDTDGRAGVAVRQELAAARARLRQAPDRATFGHLAFIATAAQPLAHALDAARRALAIGIPAERRAFRLTAASIFDADAIDVGAFAPPGLDSAPPARVSLGEQLFADARLSGTGSMSCRSCHDPARTFTDGRVTAIGANGAALARNTPTIVNSGLQVGSFADLRTTYLEDQVADVVRNPAEMHGSLERAAAALRGDATMRRHFALAFPAPGAADSLVTPLRIRQALAAYMRSLITLDTPVDRALRGDTAALSPAARAGFDVFVGKGRCAGCHFLPLTNGTVPPMYQRSEVEVIGVPDRAVRRHATIDPDVGRFAITRASPHRHAFRTPSLRLVAQTAPYMHNGVYPTLDAVIDFYDRGGGTGIGATVPNQTLPSEPLRLSPTERRQLRAFLEALSTSR